MAKKPDPPGESPEVEVAFRNFRKSVLDEYEQEQEHIRLNQELERAMGQRMGERTEQFLDQSKLDLSGFVDGLGKLKKAAQEEMKAYLEKVRPQYINREPHLDARLLEQGQQAMTYIKPGWLQPYLIGADVLGTPEALKRYEGVSGNPAKWVYDPSQQWKGEASSTGSDPCLGGWEYCPAGTIWYYTSPVSGTGNFSVNSWMYYHGFHTMFAFPMPLFFCAYAAIKVTTKLYVYQQVQTYPKYSKIFGYDERDAINKESYGGASSGVLEGSARNSVDVNVTSPGQLYIAVMLSVQVAARGNFSYTEINFRDGAANYVNAPFVAISY
jgi:hypothetical protein